MTTITITDRSEKLADFLMRTDPHYWPHKLMHRPGIGPMIVGFNDGRGCDRCMGELWRTYNGDYLFRPSECAHYYPGDMPRLAWLQAHLPASHARINTGGIDGLIEGE